MGKNTRLVGDIDSCWDNVEVVLVNGRIRDDASVTSRRAHMVSRDEHELILELWKG